MFCEIAEPQTQGNFAVAIGNVRGFFSKRCEYLTDPLDALLFSEVWIKGQTVIISDISVIIYFVLIPM